MAPCDWWIGWAPIIFSGLWIPIILGFAITLIGSATLLLDNAPFSAGGILSFAFCSILIYTNKIFASPLQQEDLQKKTASRSQFRPSGHQRRALLVFWALFGIYLFGGLMRSEGFITSMGDERVDVPDKHFDAWPSTKQHGWEPRKIQESHQTGFHRQVCKRSFKRALTRARNHGITWYKGRLYTASQLGTQQATPAVPRSKNVNPPKAIQRRRLTCFSWNCNGLPPTHWDFLMMWLEQQTIDVLLLQETHWPFSSDWMSKGYMIVHSGTQTNQAGLLRMVSKRICHPSDLSWHEHIPGRV